MRKQLGQQQPGIKLESKAGWKRLILEGEDCLIRSSTTAQSVVQIYNATLVKTSEVLAAWIMSLLSDVVSQIKKVSLKA